MNPIIEEEDSDDQTPRGEYSMPLPSSQRVYQTPGSPIDFSDATLDASDEVLPTPSPAELKADPVNKWLEFKPAPARITEGATNQEAFPVLVRRIDVDPGPLRKNSIGKESSAANKFDESPTWRPDPSSFSMSASEFIKFDKQKSLDSDEEEKTRQEEGFISGAKQNLTPSPLDKVLEYQRAGKHSPEDLLLMAISEQDNPLQGRRMSIWAKLGSRLRPEETLGTVMAI